MSTLVCSLDEVGRGDLSLVGGKGANLGELRHLAGVLVPEGICVTTAAFERVVVGALGEALTQLQAPSADDLAALRARVEAVALPEELVAAIVGGLRALGGEGVWAVRSSAVAEDSAAASFAGQSDTALNVVGEEAVLRALRGVWASLYTERAAATLHQQGLPVGEARMAVVIQRMLRPQASGVMFTADPVTGHRRRLCVEAVLGLGDAFVSGRAQADRFTVRDGQLIERALVADRVPALTDAQVLRLAALGRRVEAHFGSPQDIEWCLGDDTLHLVQSRPITTIFPPPAPADDNFHVYLSVGHQQMMTDPLRPLGRSVFQATALRPMVTAGGRLFVDVSAELRRPAMRAAVLGAVGGSDPLMGDALRSLIDRGALGEDVVDAAAPPRGPGPPAPPPSVDDPDLVPALIAEDEAEQRAVEVEVAAVPGPELIPWIQHDLTRLKQSLLEPRRGAVVMAGFGAAAWLNEKMKAWLGVTSAADTLTLSAPNNVTTEMGLALMQVADEIRPFPEVVRHLQTTTDARFWRGLLTLDGGPQVHAALAGFIARYGARCVGEIDITRPRFAESPTALTPLLLTNIQHAQPGEAERRVARGLAAAQAMEAELLTRLGALPDGEAKVAETQAMIRRLRALTGYREHPKFKIVRRYWAYKQALLAELDKLVAEGALATPDDAWFLTLDELHELIETRRPNPTQLRARRAEHSHHTRLTPPRVLTSDGESVAGAYRRGRVPEGALVGLPVSVGVVEGRARVALDLKDARVEAGDILVTTFTDPSWTPLFVHLKALVTEVGGLMTHGAVIARELGVPAVVAVVGATRQIHDGQRVRVDGTAGTVELLD